jgi:hypothetical protein
VIPRSLATCAIGRPDSNTSLTPRSSSSSGYLRGLAIFAEHPFRPGHHPGPQGLRETRDGSTSHLRRVLRELPGHPSRRCATPWADHHQNVAARPASARTSTSHHGSRRAIRHRRRYRLSRQPPINRPPTALRTGWRYRRSPRRSATRPAEPAKQSVSYTAKHFVSASDGTLQGARRRRRRHSSRRTTAKTPVRAFNGAYVHAPRVFVSQLWRAPALRRAA